MNIDEYADLLAHCLVTLKHARQRGLFENDDLIDLEVSEIFINYRKSQDIKVLDDSRIFI